MSMIWKYWSDTKLNFLAFVEFYCLIEWKFLDLSLEIKKKSWRREKFTNIWFPPALTFHPYTSDQFQSNFPHTHISPCIRNSFLFITNFPSTLSFQSISTSFILNQIQFHEKPFLPKNVWIKCEPFARNSTSNMEYKRF